MKSHKSNLSDFHSIPIFDFNQFLNSNITERQQFILRLRDVCHNIGFFYIKNHGIQSQLMQHIFTSTKYFFDLPQEEKDALSITNSPHYRGYGKLGAEITEGIRDFKETFDLGLEQLAQNISADKPYLILQGPNQWPISNSLNWKKTILEYLSAMQKLSEQLMFAMSLALGVEEDFFVKQFCSNSEDAYAILRLLRYPPGRKSTHSEIEIGVGSHVDSGCLVFLLQDEVGGLQVQNCSGEWIDAPPIPDTFVVNIGTMLQIWSNNYFLATPHRVINVSDQIRHSVPFFFEPNLSSVVTPLTLSSELLATMTRPLADSNTRVVYGEHMLKVYKRSFPENRA